MCVCVRVCVEREITNILVGDTQLTIQQRGLGNCPGWKGDSKFLDGLKDSDGDKYQLSAFKLWHCQQKVARRKQPGSILPESIISYNKFTGGVDCGPGTSCVGTTSRVFL